MFGSKIATTVSIEADAGTVWSVLTDRDRSWSPFVRTLDGRLEPGERLTVRLQPEGGRAMTFRPRVLRAEPGRTLVWLGRTGLPFVFDGEHRFEIVDEGPGRVRLEQSERFSGVLVPLFTRRFWSRTRAGFEALNEAVRDRAEERAGAAA
jgi:hypothetical protein